MFDAAPFSGATCTRHYSDVGIREMNKYTVSIEVPVLATDDRAAIVAQLGIFQQVQLALSRGLRAEHYLVNELSHEEFTSRTSVKRVE